MARNPRPSFRLLLVVAAASATGLGLGSCTGENGSADCEATPLSLACTTTPRVTDGCTTPISISVSAGITPRIDWTPQCGISRLVIQDDETGLHVWSFSVPERAPIGPSLRYGVLPPGAILEGPTRPLLSGTRYRIYLAMLIGGDVIAGQGVLTFRP